MSRVPLLWLAVAVGIQLASAYPTRANTTVPLLDTHFSDIVSTFTVLDQNGDITSPADSKPSDDAAADEYGDWAVPYYVKAAASQVLKTVPEAVFLLIDDYYVGTNNVGHVHFQQVIDGMFVDTAYFKVNVLENGTVLSFGHSFHSDSPDSLTMLRRDENNITPLEAFETAVKLLDLPITGVANAAAEKVDGAGESYTIKHAKGCVADPTAQLVYVGKDASLVLTWRIETDIGSNWLVSYVDAVSGSEITRVIDYKDYASYEAFPWGTMNPDEGSRKLIVDPEDTPSSPFGWHSNGTQNYTTLRGNNAFITIGDNSTNKAVATSPSLVFSYPYSPASTDWQKFVNASATQAFYTINKFHDILYTLGFDEAAGNFQASNNGKGGKAGDPVEIVIHSGRRFPAIETPADGQSPRLMMSIWRDAGTPYRDFVFDSTVLLHEYMHGVTRRLIGGPATGGCLGRSRSISDGFPDDGFSLDGFTLNEGYSDFVPTLLRVKSGDTRDKNYAIADWSMGRAVGIRSHYISTSLQTTPLTFESLNALGANRTYDPDLYTVWPTALYEVFWNLVDTYGIGDVDKVTLDADGVPQGARYYMLRLILDSDALITCLPNHLQARDAILQADRLLSEGANQCAIWKGFAKRGFGQDAIRGDPSGMQGRVNGFAVPSGC